MITGIHALIYTNEPDALRAFFRDQLKLEHVAVFGGWPLFTTPTVELGCHPAREHGAPDQGTHRLSFYCDDLEGTMADLRQRGVEFASSVEKRLYGASVELILPDGTTAELYEPAYRGPWSQPLDDDRDDGSA